VSIRLKKLKTRASAFVLLTFLFTGLPLPGLFMRAPFSCAAWIYVLLPYYAFPALALLAGVVCGAVSGFILDLPFITVLCALPSYFIFYFEAEPGLPLLRLALIYAGAALLGLYLAFPFYCGRRLVI
jgi:hypothetical protein